MAGSKIDFSSGFSGVSGIKYVVQGATLKCTGCPAPTNLKVMPRSALIEGKPAATIIDSVPQMNIPNFPGPCSGPGPGPGPRPETDFSTPWEPPDSACGLV